MASINVGDKFHRLTILSLAGNNRYGQRLVKVLCDCGNTTTVMFHQLGSGRTKSCGCLQREKASETGKKAVAAGQLNSLGKTGDQNARYGVRETLVSQKYPESYGKCRGSYANQTINDIKQKAAKRGKAWSIPNLQAFELCLQPCAYCGSEPNWPESRNGIDRVDNSRGYELSNCVSCCNQCNTTKGEMTMTEFEQYSERLYLKFQAKKQA